MIEHPWKVYSSRLRPDFGGHVVEIQTADGRPVIPWAGFDPMSPTRRLAMARHIVKVHNEALKQSELRDKIMRQLHGPTR